MPRPFALVGCDVLRQETERLLASCPHAVDCVWIEQGLHDTPEKMNAEIRAAVERQRGRTDAEAVLLLYGLCSNGVVGVTAPGMPLVVPRVHDCISLYLGGKERYDAEHAREPGTYWFSRGFIHRKDLSAHAGGGMMGHAPGEGEYTPARREELYREYCEQYGEENADYLMEVWVDSWKANYTRAVLLTWDHPDLDEDRERVRAIAAESGWRYEEMPVDLRLVKMLLAGDWPEEEFLVLQPGESLRASNDDCVLCACC